MAAERDPEKELREWPRLTSMEGKKLAQECLDSTIVGTLGTHSAPRGTWCATVFFTFDEDFNIYFVSQRTTRHMTDIFSDNRVSFSTFMPISKSKGAHIEVQLDGIALPVNEGELDKVYTERERRLTGEGTWLPGAKDVERVHQLGAVFMKIKPQAVYYVNSSLFGGDRKLVPLDFSKH